MFFPLYCFFYFTNGEIVPPPSTDIIKSYQLLIYSEKQSKKKPEIKNLLQPKNIIPQ